MKHLEKHEYKITLHQEYEREDICKFAGKTDRIRDIICKNGVAVLIEKYTKKNNNCRI